jgi:hypothetical protein
MRNLALLLALAGPLSCNFTYFTKPADAYRMTKTVTDLKFNDNVFRLELELTIPGVNQDITELFEQIGLLEGARKARANGFAFFTVAEHRRHRWPSCAQDSPCETIFSEVDTILCFKEAPKVETTVYEANQVVASVTTRYGFDSARAAR